MPVRRPLRLLLALCLLSAAHHVLAERRALVIGNADYAERRLSNPVNDADDMAAKLKSLGFAVTLAKNADKRALLDGLEAFRAQLRSDDDAVFYFAGHGAQLEGRNYLIPLNADIHRDKHLETEAVDLLRVLEALDPVQNGLKLAILDACRNNPYPGSGRAGTRGLAPVPKVPNQTLLWFAASPGEEADDGAGRNGLFTGQLLKVLGQPGLDVEHVFKQVAREVIAATRGRAREQHPYPEGQTLVDFWFAEPMQTFSPKVIFKTEGQISTIKPIYSEHDVINKFEYNSPQANKLIGDHAFRMQWIDEPGTTISGLTPWDKISGRVSFHRESDLIKVQGIQTGKDGNFVRIEGHLKKITNDGFIFSGIIQTKVSYIAQGKICNRKGEDMNFKITENRPYWRLRDPYMENPCDSVLDYIDIKIEKIPK